MQFAKLKEERRHYVLEIPKGLVKGTEWRKGKEFFPVKNERGNLELKEITLPFTVMADLERKMKK